MTRSGRQKGFSLIEVIMAMVILALVTLFVLTSITVLTRRDIIRVDNRSRANSWANRYLEEQQTRIRTTAFVVPAWNPYTNVAIPGSPFRVTVQLLPGSVQTGQFVADTVAPFDVPRDATGAALPFAAVMAVVTIGWNEMRNGVNTPLSITRQSILVPR